MAKNYVEFSFEFSLNSPDESAWIGELLSLPCHLDDKARERLLTVFPLWDDHDNVGFCWEINKIGTKEVMWIYDGDSDGNIDFVACFIQEYLKQFAPNKIMFIEYANSCTQPVVGEFGGGAAVLTAKTVCWMSTYLWTYDKVLETIKDNPKLSLLKSLVSER